MATVHLMSNVWKENVKELQAVKMLNAVASRIVRTVYALENSTFSVVNSNLKSLDIIVVS